VLVLTKGFVLNRAGRVVVPSHFFPSLDAQAFETLDRLRAAIHRDFEAKAPSEATILDRIAAGGYRGRYELLRDVAAHLGWANRYGFTMYERRPARWRDVPRRRTDVFLAVLAETPRHPTATAIERAYQRVPASWDAAAEHVVFGILLDILRNSWGTGTDVEAVNPTVAEAVAADRLVCRLAAYDPDAPIYTQDDIIEYHHPAAPLEALMRQAMVLHNAYPWEREQCQPWPVSRLADDDVVVVLHPRSHHVLALRQGRCRARRAAAAVVVGVAPVAARPGRPVEVERHFTVMPRLEALATRRGEVVVTNEDLVRNAAYCWRPMTATEIERKTGIAERRYTELDLDDLALHAARAALEKAGRRAHEIAGVLVCSCTSARTMPSVATRLAARLGIVQAVAAYDLVAACAGLPYALAEAVRMLQETRRPILVVGAEKFSDKIGAVRASRMLFGDGAAAIVVGPADPDQAPDIEVFHTYASGPLGQVESIVWPNPDYDHGVTVDGPEVRGLVRRYLAQMVAELKALPHPEGGGRALFDAIDLVVPHQANRSMVTALAQEAGIGAERLYFNIQRVGNTSAASIGLALEDAVREGVIARPLRVFTPAFGAGAVGGYAVLRVDPSLVSRSRAQPVAEPARVQVGRGAA
jgi:3-oxoacyl-(acyl-carrier-protein) synthase III